MKKGPLSNKEKDFIDNNRSMKTEQIAEELGRSVSVVTKYIKAKAKEGSTHGLFARKEDRGVTVMTEAASAQADENKQDKETSTPRRYAGVIHKIKEN
jgi:transposase